MRRRDFDGWDIHVCKVVRLIGPKTTTITTTTTTTTTTTILISRNPSTAQSFWLSSSALFWALWCYSAQGRLPFSLPRGVNGLAKPTDVGVILMFAFQAFVAPAARAAPKSGTPSLIWECSGLISVDAYGGGFLPYWHGTFGSGNVSIQDLRNIVSRKPSASAADPE